MPAPRGIQIRRVSVTDPKDMPTKGIAETPGGTRIIYDRLFMLRQKQAPVARTPPVLPQIPGITKDLSDVKQEEREHGVIEEKSEEDGSGDKPTQQAANNENSTQNQ